MVSRHSQLTLQTSMGESMGPSASQNSLFKIQFPDQYQAGLMFTQIVTSNTIASKKISEPDLPRHKCDLAFHDVSQMRSRERVVLCEISSEKSIWHLTICELLLSVRYLAVS